MHWEVVHLLSLFRYFVNYSTFACQITLTAGQMLQSRSGEMKREIKNIVDVCVCEGIFFCDIQSGLGMVRILSLPMMLRL